MDSTVIIVILAVAGVASVLLYAVKGILDQLPDVFASARRARDAWNDLKEPDEQQPPVDAEEDEPPADAKEDDPPADEDYRAAA